MNQILHLMTQDDQPYGSTRQCCEKCGVLIEAQAWTDNRDIYYNPPRQSSIGTVFVRCEDE